MKAETEEYIAFLNVEFNKFLRGVLGTRELLLVVDKKIDETNKFIKDQQCQRIAELESKLQELRDEFNALRESVCG